MSGQCTSCHLSHSTERVYSTSNHSYTKLESISLGPNETESDVAGHAGRVVV